MTSLHNLDSQEELIVYQVFGSEGWTACTADVYENLLGRLPGRVMVIVREDAVKHKVGVLKPYQPTDWADSNHNYRPLDTY